MRKLNVVATTPTRTAPGVNKVGYKTSRNKRGVLVYGRCPREPLAKLRLGGDFNSDVEAPNLPPMVQVRN